MKYLSEDCSAANGIWNIILRLLFLKWEILLLVKTWMNLENIMLSEMQHREKDKPLHGLTYMWRK